MPDAPRIDWPQAALDLRITYAEAAECDRLLDGGFFRQRERIVRLLRDKLDLVSEVASERERAEKAEAMRQRIDTQERDAQAAGAAALRLAIIQHGKFTESGRTIRDVALSTTAGAELLERLRELREGAAWAYQLAGAIEMPVEVLDNLSALANGEKPPHDWPYPVEVECERLKAAEAAVCGNGKLLARIAQLETGLNECFDAAMPQAMPWTGTPNEKAEYTVQTLPHHLHGLNRLLTFKAKCIAQLEAEVTTKEATRAQWAETAARFRRALLRYGAHEENCSVGYMHAGECNCGLDALTATDPPVKPGGRH